MASTVNSTKTKASGYAPAKGLKMHCEMEGIGDPHVFIPPAFGFAGLDSFPLLVQSYTVLTVDLQGKWPRSRYPGAASFDRAPCRRCGRFVEVSRNRKGRFVWRELCANTAVMIAVRCPEVVGRVATYGATFGLPQIALNPRTMHLTNHQPSSPAISHIRARTTSEWLPIQSTRPRFLTTLEGFSGKDFRTKSWLRSKPRCSYLSEIGMLSSLSILLRASISSPTPSLPCSRMPELTLSSEPEKVIPVAKHFLEKLAKRIPVATARIGYQPGETR